MPFTKRCAEPCARCLQSTPPVTSSPQSNLALDVVTRGESLTRHLHRQAARENTFSTTETNYIVRDKKGDSPSGTPSWGDRHAAAKTAASTSRRLLAVRLSWSGVWTRS